MNLEAAQAAILAGDLNGVFRFLDSGGAEGVEQRDALGRTLLMVAALAGHAAIVRLLLERGADANAKNRYGANALTTVLAAETLPAEQRLEIVRLLLEHGLDVHDPLPQSGELLFVYAVRTAPEAAALMLKSSAVNVNAAGRDGRTALHAAASTERAAQLIESLLQAGAEVDSTDAAGLTPLHLAARHGNADAIRALLAAGADLARAVPRDYEELKAGDTPLKVAYRNAQWGARTLLGGPSGDELKRRLTTLLREADVAGFEQYLDEIALHEKARGQLLKHVTSVLDLPDFVRAALVRGVTSEDALSAALTTCAKGYTKSLHELVPFVSELSQRDADGDTLLTRAIRAGHAGCVDILLAAGADPDDGGPVSTQLVNELGGSARDGNYPLANAIRRRDVALVGRLLDAGANPNLVMASARHVLDLALDLGDEKVIALLRSRGAIRTPLPLRDAVKQGDVERVRELLRDAPDVSEVLPLAAAQGHVDIVDLLCADGKPSDSALDGAVVQAAQAGHGEVVSRLLAAGASPNHRTNSRGPTALRQAVQNGHGQVVHALIKAGARTLGTKLDGEDEQLVHLAVVKGNIEILTALLAAGADVNVRDPDEGTPLDVARAAKQSAIAELLEAAGARSATARRRAKKTGAAGGDPIS